MEAVEGEVSPSQESPRKVAARKQLDGTSAQMEKLIFGADDAAASEYLKDLISSAGLKDAWAEMAKKFKSVQTQHAHLMSLASREGLDRDYVTRPEFRAIVQEEYKRVLQDHSKRLTDVEAQVQEEKQARLKLQQVVVELAGHVEEELNELKPQVTDAHEWLKSLDERCEEEHEEVLKALKNQEEQLDQREETLRQEAKAIAKNLDGEILERKVIGVEVRKQKEFLNGEAFQRHIEETCQRTLQSYVRKEVMMDEVQRSTEENCEPLRVLIARIQKELAAMTEEFRTRDAYIEQCLESADARLQQKDENLSDRINAVMDELPNKATNERVDNLRGKLLYHVDVLEGLHTKLQKEATHKTQEVVVRLSEFQVILQDHEHALQHAAEEILHRGTKYDIAVLTDRVDRCASKEKMDGDLKEIREQLSWQSTKIESMQFQHGLSLQRSSSRRPGHLRSTSRALSRSSSVASDHMGMGKTLSLKMASLNSQGSDLNLMRIATDDQPEIKDGKSGDSSPSKRSENTERVDTGGNISISLLLDEEKNQGEKANQEDPTMEDDPLEVFPGLDGGPELQDALIDQQEQLQLLQDQLAEMQQASFMSGSTLTEVVQQQLEFLAQGVFCLGRLFLRPRKDHSLLHRQEQCASLLKHLHSVMHWVIHRQRPAEWDPTALTTIALKAAQDCGHGAHENEQGALSRRESLAKAQQRMSLRRAKAASQPKPTPERSNSPEFFTGRQFATGGVGWQQRGIPAAGSYDEMKRPSTSGAVLGASLPVNATDGKRILVATPGVAEAAEPKMDLIALPRLAGDSMSARGRGPTR